MNRQPLTRAVSDAIATSASSGVRACGNRIPPATSMIGYGNRTRSAPVASATEVAIRISVMFKGGRTYWKLTWKVVEKGLIGYKWQRYDARNKKNVDIIQAMASQDWVDISETDADQDAKALFESMDEYLGLNDKISKLEDYIEGPIDIIGNTIMSAYQADMVNKMTPATPTSVPVPNTTAPPAPDNVIPFRPRQPAPPPPATQPAPLKKAS